MGQAESDTYNQDQIDEENGPQFQRIKEFYEIERNLQYIKKITGDCAYGDIKISKNIINNSIVATKNFIMTKDDDFEKIVQKAKLLHSIKSPYIVKLLNFGKQIQEDFCSKYIRSIMVFEYFKDNLQKKMIHRKQLDLLFREVDIYFFLFCIIQSLQSFKAKGFSHGDIRPKTVLLGKDGNYKLTECNFMASQNSYKTFLLGGMGSCYLAPEQLVLLQKREIHPKNNPFLSDIFSLGMICLEMATLTNINTCYDFRKFSIDYARVTDLLNQVCSTHSENLAEIISGMIEIQEDKRWSLDQIFQSLQPFLSDIQEIHCSPIKYKESQIEDYDDQEYDPNQSENSQFIDQNIDENGYETNQNLETHKTDQKKLQSHQKLLNQYQSNNKLPQNFDDSAHSDIPNEEDDYSNLQNNQIQNHSQIGQQPLYKQLDTNEFPQTSQKSFSPQKQEFSNNINLQTDENNQELENQEEFDEQQYSSNHFNENNNQEEKLKHRAKKFNQNNLSPEPPQQTGQFYDNQSPPFQQNISNLYEKSPENQQQYPDQGIEDADLFNNLEQLDNMVNQAINQSTNIKEKFSRVSLHGYPTQNTSMNNQSPDNIQNRLTVQSQGNVDNDQEVYEKMQNLSQKKKILAASPQKSQQKSFQESPLKGLDSNTLYEMYMEEYNKIRSNIKN